MKNKTTFALMAFTLVYAVPAFAADPAYPAYNTTKTLYADNDLRGKLAPKLEVEKWISGAVPETKGKVVLIDFWATWCPPCRGLIPELNDLKKKFGDDLVIIGISDEKPEIVQGFYDGKDVVSRGQNIKGIKMDYNVAVDTTKKMNKVLGVKGIPHVMVISADGIVRWQGFPQDKADTLTEQVMSQIIAANKAAMAKSSQK